MKKITIYIEDADGETDKPTGVHIDYGDGSAIWLRGADLDRKIPTGSPRDLRQIGKRLFSDLSDLETRGVTKRVVPKASTPAPTPAEIDAGEAEDA